MIWSKPYQYHNYENNENKNHCRDGSLFHDQQFRKPIVQLIQLKHWYRTLRMNGSPTTLPNGLVLRPSTLKGEGMGVWTTRTLPAGLRIGPFEGKIVPVEKIGQLADTSSIWEVGLDFIEFEFHCLFSLNISFISHLVSRWNEYIHTRIIRKCIWRKNFPAS